MLSFIEMKTESYCGGWCWCRTAGGCLWESLCCLSGAQASASLKSAKRPGRRARLSRLQTQILRLGKEED